MARLPYKQTPLNEAAETAATSATGQPDHNGLGFSASGHPAAGVTQRSECGPYKAEVAGSNPAARTSSNESSPSSPAHTPGPWEYTEYLPDEEGNNLIDEGYHQIRLGEGYRDDEKRVGGTVGGCIFEPDARLIAAAPLLYEIAKYVRDNCDTDYVLATMIVRAFDQLEAQ